jgi:hypothetical protein
VNPNDSIAAGKNDKDLVPKAAMLDAWAQDAWNNGIQIDHLEDMQKVAVQTANNLYEIVIISGHEGDVLVRGGKFFAELTPANLAGATMGGSFCKMRGIYVGFRMEFTTNGKRIITSPVETIAVLQPEDDKGIRGDRW